MSENKPRLKGLSVAIWFIILCVVVITVPVIIWNLVFDEMGCINMGCINRYQCIREGRGTDRITDDYMMSVHWIKNGFCDEINIFKSCGSDCSGVIR